MTDIVEAVAQHTSHCRPSCGGLLWAFIQTRWPWTTALVGTTVLVQVAARR